MTDIIVDMKRHGAFLGKGGIDANAKAKALAVFDAATALVDTRIAAIRQCVDVEDTEVVIDTEALAARAVAWRNEVHETIRVIEEASAVARAETPRSSADDRHDAVVGEWGPYIYHLKASVQKIERDGGEELAAVRRAGFESDPIFSHLLRRNAKRPEKRFSFSDRLVAKWSRFGEGLDNYKRTLAYPAERDAWLTGAREAISEAEAKIDASRRALEDAAMAARAVHDEAAAVVERGWMTLLDLLSEDAPAFSDLDLDAACGVAREAAAAGLRTGTTEVPLAAEQEERLAALAASRKELKQHMEWLDAIV
ncbi:hypothetical protein [Rhizobium sp. BK176]|uniref:hypothetical protein n=1 Tax=Rhizobium sp. BK176 TaxID=2587071 RepID=UPI00216A2114|nr:hypothetical protein [Rhizobium sp. BK176]MCS4089920.1 hypothetical protein [Rhizobium sp. BK176]